MALEVRLCGMNEDNYGYPWISVVATDGTPQLDIATHRSAIEQLLSQEWTLYSGYNSGAKLHTTIKRSSHYTQNLQVLPRNKRDAVHADLQGIAESLAELIGGEIRTMPPRAA